jgi:ribose transport system ATP-binding protein
VTDLLLETTGVVKRYGAVVALRDASMSVLPGEVHALLGANGAGKSTLVKILTGAVHPDAGRIVVRGQAREVHSPAEARRSGLVSVYQEPAIIPDLDVGANLRLTDTPVGPFREWLAELGIPDLDLSELARDLPLATLRVVDLARALAIGPDVLLLDEMTAALPADLTENVLRVVGRQRETGRAVIFISHRLMEIRALCDRATVLRDGESVGVVEMGPGAEEEIVRLMLGPSTVREDEEAAVRQAAAGRASELRESGVTEPTTAETGGAAPRLSVRRLRAGRKVQDVSFDLRAGEVLGLVALEGQGQDELFGILSGAQRPDGGELLVDGRAKSFRHPADAIRAGLVFVPANRVDALLMKRSVRENIALPDSARATRWGPIDMRAERQRVSTAIGRLQIDTRAQSEVRRLSGGNQQKVTIARWITGHIGALLCFDPTRGIDIRTKREIYQLVRDLAEAGAAVLLYTSELEEVSRACDRVIVLYGGRIVEELPADVDEPTLMRAAHGLPNGAEVAAAPATPVPAGGAGREAGQ